MKKYIEFAKNIFFGCSEAWNELRIAAGRSFKYDRMAADLIRYTHSVEKGLSIREPRLGFGQAKQKEMLAWMHELSRSETEYHRQAVAMAACALKAYVDYHDAHAYANEFIEKMRAEVETFRNAGCGLCTDGGTTEYLKEENTFDLSQIERFFCSRHSIREFDMSPVDYDTVDKAIRLAQTAPSACNRQAVRVYVYSPERADAIRQWLTGIGGFEKEIGAYILITGKQSAYAQNERYQYIVSASMYAAYLSLSLHAYGMGACIVQRPVIANRAWKRLRKKLDIPQDEQAICVLGVGNLKDACAVPVSHRLPSSAIVRYDIQA